MGITRNRERSSSKASLTPYRSEDGDNDESQKKSIRVTESSIVTSLTPKLKEQIPEHPHYNSRVTRVIVRAGRHIDSITFVYSSGASVSHGRLGGEVQDPFDLHPCGNEYIVRVIGRQGQLLDAVQFVTNWGRRSAFYGGDGGKMFEQFPSPMGAPVVDIVSDTATDFCPRMFGLAGGAALKAAYQKNIFRLMLCRNTRQLFFNTSSTSVFKLLVRGRPSVLRLSTKGKTSMLRVFLRGKPSIMRSILDGEQHHVDPHSLFRMLATAYGGFNSSLLQMYMGKPKRRSRDTPSLAQLVFQGKPSLTESFFKKSGLTKSGKPMSHSFFFGDPKYGRPSLIHELFQGEERGRTSLFRLLMMQEDPAWLASNVSSLQRQANTNRASIDRSSQKTKPLPPQERSLLRMLVTGLDPLLHKMLVVGKGFLMERMLREGGPEADSIARVFLTDPLGKNPSLARYLFSGEEKGIPSVMRLLLAGEGRQGQTSVFRLLLTGDNNGKRRTLLELLCSGEPSNLDLFFGGEVNGERSLARLFLGTSFTIKDNRVKTGEALHVDDDVDEMSLMQAILAGEEDGGPGISLLRLVCFGEEENEDSLLRILLLGEAEGKPSLFRALVAVWQAGLIGANNATSDLTKWGDNIHTIGDAIKKSTPGGTTWGSAIQQLVTTATDTLMWQQHFLQFTEALKSLSRRDENFKDTWQRTWKRIAREGENAGVRAHKDSVWKVAGAQIKRVANAMGSNNFPLAVAEIVTLISLVDKANQRNRKVAAAAAAAAGSSK